MVVSVIPAAWLASPRIEKFNKRPYFPGNRSREGMIATRIPREKPLSLLEVFYEGIRGNPFEQDRKFPRPFSYPHPYSTSCALKRRHPPPSFSIGIAVIFKAEYTLYTPYTSRRHYIRGENSARDSIYRNSWT